MRGRRDGMDETRARELLGLDVAADVDVDVSAVKRAFRSQAHDLHPDRGGDPRAFQDLHVAYRLLIAVLERPAGPPAPRVARGRPSRGQRPVVEPSAPAGPLVALTAVERRALASHGRAAPVLDAQTLARLLIDGGLRLASRAPGSRMNRFATSLDTGATSTLTVSATRVELAARSRAARRAVTALDVAGVRGLTWSRRRGDAVSVLSATLGSGPDAPRGAGGPGVLGGPDLPSDVSDGVTGAGSGAAGAHDARLRATADAVAALLDALTWPLWSWQLDVGRH